MNIQSVMNGFCEGVSNAASFAANTLSSVGQWMGRTVVVVGQTLAGVAQSVAQFAQPYLQALQSFVSAHQSEILVGAVALAVGAIGYALISNAFSQGNCQACTTPATAAT